MHDDTIVEALHESESTLAGLLEIAGTLASSEQNGAPSATTPATVAAASGATASGIIEDELAVGIARPYNQRIPLPGDGFLPDELNDDDGLLLEENDDALSRDRVKKASKQVLLDQDKRKKRVQKKVSVQDVDDFAPDDVLLGVTAANPSTPAKKK